MQDQDCIFCKIIEGKIPCAKIYEDNEFIAFLDIAPSAKGHSLVIPKIHVKNVLEIEASYAENLFKIIQKIAPAIMQATDSDGFNVVQNNFASAGQTVFHVHWHIIPRKNDDGLIPWNQGSYGDMAQMKKMQEEIINHI